MPPSRRRPRYGSCSSAGSRARRSRARRGARAGRVRARLPGEHNRRNAAAALAALELAGVRATRRRARCRSSGRVAALRAPRRSGRCRVYDDYGTTHGDRGHTGGRARDRCPSGARPLPAAPPVPHAASRTRVRRALAPADAVAVTTSTRRANSPSKASAGSSSRRSPPRGRACGWPGCRRSRTGRVARRRARPGDIALTVGAGDVERAVPFLLEKLA